jgi:hypothetical protein
MSKAQSAPDELDEAAPLLFHLRAIGPDRFDIDAAMRGRYSPIPL